MRFRSGMQDIRNVDFLLCSIKAREKKYKQHRRDYFLIPKDKAELYRMRYIDFKVLKTNPDNYELIYEPQNDMITVIGRYFQIVADSFIPCKYRLTKLSERNRLHLHKI